MSASWGDLFDRGAAYDGDRERIRTELESIREDEDA
ncbi:hypothetical protein C489_08480 [Natrinema versiforme JCM 10478]|uniref:Uncharacterized protein n=1 Tax=Natrinema versiforme JCM 10478 TaxID=1227496 RepID=L9Y2Z2_9EURY|nr:hypothetical protein C489_08480 [Natrinema versiforme JCM 10478]